jgi:hypothetical protein
MINIKKIQFQIKAMISIELFLIIYYKLNIKNLNIH